MKFRAWLKAARPPSQTYIAFPILFGQMIWLAQGGSISWTALVLAQLFGVFDQLYIVFANDWADVETDRHNSTYNIFSGGSRVLVEGMLSRRELGRAAVLMTALALATGAGLWLLQGSAVPLTLMALGILLLWAYSFPPFRLNYRGAGELLQTLGVGGVLPLVGFTAQGGALTAFPWAVLAMTLPVSLACAVTTSLPDEPSDRSADKRTASVLLGVSGAQATAYALFLLGLAAWMLLRPLGSGLLFHLMPLLLPALLLLLAFTKYGAAPGSKPLTGLVTALVAANVFLFLGVSLMAGLIR